MSFLIDWSPVPIHQLAGLKCAKAESYMNKAAEQAKQAGLTDQKWAENKHIRPIPEIAACGGIRVELSLHLRCIRYGQEFNFGGAKAFATFDITCWANLTCGSFWCDVWKENKPGTLR